MNILTVLLNFFMPGIGSFVVGRGGAGVAQLLIFCRGISLAVTLIMLPFGLLLMAVAWVWGLITAATANNEPQQVVVVKKKD